MQYQVPQFIEVEDKIFGPLTLKQFLYVAGGGAVSFILWSVIPIKFVALIVVIPTMSFFLALAFYKVNGRPLINTVENAFSFMFSNKLYIWKKVDKPVQEKKEESIANDLLNVPKISESKLKEMSWSLDINSKVEKNDAKSSLDLKI